MAKKSGCRPGFKKVGGKCVADTTIETIINIGNDLFKKMDAYKTIMDAKKVRVEIQKSDKRNALVIEARFHEVANRYTPAYGSKWLDEGGEIDRSAVRILNKHGYELEQWRPFKPILWSDTTQVYDKESGYSDSPNVKGFIITTGTKS